MNEPLFCISCSSRPCEKSENSVFEICKYGIAFFNRDGIIEKKEPKISLSNISRNLRHEINPILQTIIEQTTKIDPTLSIKTIDLSNPLSVVIGSTVILDNFIQMITGVHEFHTSPTGVSDKEIRLSDLVNQCYDIYSVLKEEERAGQLKLNNLIPDNYYVSFCSDFVKYILAVLIDNAWKYSIDNSTLTVNINSTDNGRSRIKIVNRSKTFESHLNIFDLGVKASDSSKGFGYGLYWTKLLEFNYNAIAHQIEDNDDNKFYISHTQQPTTANPGISYQEFSLNNLITEKK